MKALNNLMEKVKGELESLKSIEAPTGTTGEIDRNFLHNYLNIINNIFI